MHSIDTVPRLSCFLYVIFISFCENHPSISVPDLQIFFQSLNRHFHHGVLVLLKGVQSDLPFRLPVVEVPTINDFAFNAYKLPSRWKSLLSCEGLPVNRTEELHPALFGDHLHGPGNRVLPLSDEAESNPVEADLWVPHRVQAILLLHLGQFLEATRRKNGSWVLSIFFNMPSARRNWPS